MSIFQCSSTRYKGFIHLLDISISSPFPGLLLIFVFKFLAGNNLCKGHGRFEDGGAYEMDFDAFDAMQYDFLLNLGWGFILDRAFFAARRLLVFLGLDCCHRHSTSCRVMRGISCNQDSLIIVQFHILLDEYSIYIFVLSLQRLIEITQ